MAGTKWVVNENVLRYGDYSIDIASVEGGNQRFLWLNPTEGNYIQLLDSEHFHKTLGDQGLPEPTDEQLAQIDWDMSAWAPTKAPAPKRDDTHYHHQTPTGKLHWRYVRSVLQYKGYGTGETRKVSTYTLHNEAGQELDGITHEHDSGAYCFGENRLKNLKELNESLKKSQYPKLHPTAIRVRNAALKVINRAAGLITSMIFTTLAYPLMATADWVAKGWERMAGRESMGRHQGKQWAKDHPYGRSTIRKGLYRLSGLVQILTAPLAYVFSLLTTILWRAPKRGLIGGLRESRLDTLHAWVDAKQPAARKGDNVVFGAKHVLVALAVVFAWSALIMGLAFGPLATVPVFSAIKAFATFAMGKLGIDIVGVGAAAIMQATAVAAVLTTAATAVAAGAIALFQQLGNLIGFAAEKGAKRSESRIGTPFMPSGPEAKEVVVGQQSFSRLQAGDSHKTLAEATDASGVYENVCVKLPAMLSSSKAPSSDSTSSDSKGADADDGEGVFLMESAY